MTTQKLFAALVAVIFMNCANAGETDVSLQRDYKAARGVLVTEMPAGVTLAEAQRRLRAFLVEQDSEIVREIAGEIEARTPFGVAHSDDGLIVGHIRETMTASNGHVWFKRRVMRLSQSTGGAVRVEWCHKTLEKNVAGARVPERVGCKVTFAEWKLLRDATAPLALPAETGVASTQGPAAENRP
jgi:hypothetical protein